MSDTSAEGYVALAKQTAQGTPATTLTTGHRVTSVDIGATTENLVADAEIGGGRDRYSEGVALGSYHVSGDMESYLRFDTLGTFLLMAGFVESPAPVQEATTGAWTHTFIPGAFTYGTIETAWGRNRAVRRVSDCLVDELEFSTAGNEFATMTASILGLAEAWQASPSVPTFAALDSMGNYLGSAITLDGLGTYRASDMSLTIANNISNDEEVVGQRALADITPGRREIGFSLNIKPQGTAANVTDLYRAAAYGGKALTAPGDAEPYHTSAVLTFGSRKLIGTSTANRYSVEFTMPDVVLDAFPLEGSGDDPIEAQVEGLAFAGTSSVTSIKLRNSRATAY